MHASEITVYTLPSCVKCDWTKKDLDELGVGYKVVDLTADETAYEKVKALGYMGAPVVVAGTRDWSGYKPEKIKELAA